MTNVLTRRKLLCVTGAGGALHLATRKTSAAGLAPALAVVDHLVLGVADMDRGTSWLEERTSLKPLIINRSPRSVTWNALLSLGNRQYLEIVAPGPAQPDGGYRNDLHSLSEPRLLTWAAVTDDITALAVTISEAGFRVSGPRGGNSVMPSGATYPWRMLRVSNDFAVNGIDPFPYFIEWVPEYGHPAREMPIGCRLEAFQIEHPDADVLRETLQMFDVDAPIERAANARLAAVLSTPNGELELG